MAHLDVARGQRQHCQGVQRGTHEHQEPADLLCGMAGACGMHARQGSLVGGRVCACGARRAIAPSQAANEPRGDSAAACGRRWQYRCMVERTTNAPREPAGPAGGGLSGSSPDIWPYCAGGAQRVCARRGWQQTQATRHTFNTPNLHDPPLEPAANAQ